MKSNTKIKKVLIVEDSVLQSEMYKLIFQKYQSELLFAANGAVALGLLVENPDIELIITDIKMPIMDGKDFISTARNSGLAKCPIIALSSKGNEAELLDALEVGASSFIIKPWSMTKFHKMIEELLHSQPMKKETQELAMALG